MPAGLNRDTPGCQPTKRLQKGRGMLATASSADAARAEDAFTFGSIRIDHFRSPDRGFEVIMNI